MLIAGHLDFLAPSRGMFVMHRLIPNSRLLVQPYGSHFVIWEYPHWAALNLVDFFYDPSPGDKKKKRPSIGLVPLQKESDYAVDEFD